MRDKMKKVCCLGMCLLLFLTAGCREKETLTLEEVEERHTEQSTNEKECEDAKTKQPEEAAGQAEEAEKEVFVYVCGEVRSPGVYELHPGSRIYEAIRAAGGMTEQADEQYVNQAESLKDGQQIYIPSKEEVQTEGKAPIQSGEESGTERGKENLNTAGKEELMTLTGIGEEKADSIIRYREENGGFKSPEDLMKIEGIKTGVFDKIKDKITV